MRNDHDRDWVQYALDEADRVAARQTVQTPAPQRQPVQTDAPGFDPVREYIFCALIVPIAFAIWWFALAVS